MNEPATQPVHHPISQLVYSASRDQVTDVWVGGEHVLEDRRLKQCLIRPKYWNARPPGRDASPRDDAKPIVGAALGDNPVGMLIAAEPVHPPDTL